MRKYWLILLTFVSLPALCQGNQIYTANVRTECPVEGLRIVPRVYSFRIYAPGGEGWRPDSKMALDLRVKNKGSRGIAVATLEVQAHHVPHAHSSYDSVIALYDHVLLNIQPGEERQLYFPSAGVDLIDLANHSTGDGWISVFVSELRYADGEIVDLRGCNLGDAPIPSPFVPVRPASPSEIVPIAGDVTPPRVLESHLMDEQTSWRGQPTSAVLSFIVEVDGSPQDIKVDSGTGDAQVDQKAIETLRKWNFAPAMMGDKPVATRIKMEFKLGR